MSSPRDGIRQPPNVNFLAGGGEMGERIRAFDWSKSPVGLVGEWPQSLKTAVSICLGSRYPIVIWWGKEALTQFYNDAYISFLGVTKHPGWLGRSGRECWSEIWSVMAPMLESVFATGEATWSEDFLDVLDRNIPHEEGYFTFSYSPIRDDAGKVGGIFCACNETTGRVVGERRLRTLRDLGRTVMEAKSAEEACEITARTLAANPADVPFALIYLLDGEARVARLVATAGLEAGSGAAPDRIDLSEPAEELAAWPLRRAFDAAAAVRISDLAGRFGQLPGGPWPESPEAAFILPIPAPGQARPTGFLVAGLSPRRVVDADYRGFLDLVAGHVATALANAQAYEEERRRAEALAEVDRAKTLFFTNVSHEFRTPLTLLLGPTEDALAEVSDPNQRERLQVVHRNALRLQKLVNTLLDFSRIEAGRIQASYEPTDLAAFTGELASTFRSAVEKAGMRLSVNCPPLAEPVYVDREMWEKIVLNLVSNAFKFTLEGEIEVALRDAGGRVELTVRDTGSGITEEQLPHVFERFHRVEGVRARTHEGTGIGLAFVQELVKLHGGTIGVQSVPGKGSTFTVSIPKGTAHLPTERIGAARERASTALSASHYVNEALRWLPEGPLSPSISDSWVIDDLHALPIEDTDRGRAGGPLPRIVWADDNADVRDYVRRILSARYDVEAVPDGEAALAAIRRKLPDLVLTDAMMPLLDGFGLLKALRADERTRTIPVILLSARAGEEARVEGMEAGADDYLVKPFGARELLARVSAHLQMARLRRETSEALRQSEERKALLLKLSDVLRPLADPVAIQAEASRLLGEHLRVNRVSYAEVEGEEFVIQRCYASGVAPIVGRFPLAAFGETLLAVYRSGEAVAVADVAAEPRFTAAEREAYRAAEIAAFAGVMLVKDGRWVAAFGVHSAVPRTWTPDEQDLIREVAERTWAAVERGRAEEARSESERRFRDLADAMPQIVYVTRVDGTIEFVNRQWREYTRMTTAEAGELPAVIHADDLPGLMQAWQAASASGTPLTAEFRLKRASDGVYRWFLTRNVPIRDGEGRVVRWYGTSTEIDDRKRIEEELRESDRRKDEFLATLAHELRNPLAPIRNSLNILRMTGAANPTTERLHEMMERQVNHLVRLVDDLLEISRISRGKIDLRKEQVELAAVIRSAVETSRPLLEAAHHQLAISLPSEPLALDADPVRLAQVFANLLNNAAKYTDEGGQIWLTAKVAKGSQESPDGVVVSVRDTGVGIPADMLPRVFELFTQVDRSAGRAQGGLGIGLTLVRSLVQLHGGRVEARSEGLGQGSEFVVHLPLAKGSPADGARLADQPPALLSPRRVLVVDDNRDAADSLGMLLKFVGADVQVVYDGAAALKTLDVYQPAVVLLDIGMPGMDGYEVARRIRQHPRGRDVLLIALTGWGQEEDRRRTHTAGFDHHLVKPADVNALQTLLASLEGNEGSGFSSRSS
jgi:PAS domain S-box-containing protein